MKKILLAAFALFGFAKGAYATDIQLIWEAPDQYEDGTPLTAIGGYTLYYTLDNVVQTPIQVEASRTDHTLVDVAAGSYTFQVATSSGGSESERSEPVSVTIDDKKPIKIELTVRVVD